MINVRVLGGGGYARLFKEDGYNVMDEGQKGEQPDLIVFTGGADVDPLLYGHTRNKRSGPSHEDRDHHEAAIFKMAVNKGIPMVGICRGAQFLCAMSGGKLFQHVTGHLGNHMAQTNDGTELLVTSTHHQMMDPRGTAHKVLLSVPDRLSDQYHQENQVKSPPIDYETVYFTDTKALAHQPHPEMMEKEAPYRKWFLATVESLLAEDL